MQKHQTFIPIFFTEIFIVCPYFPHPKIDSTDHNFAFSDNI